MEYIKLAKVFLENFQTNNIRTRSESFLMLFSYLKTKGMKDMDSNFKSQISELVSFQYPISAREIMMAQVEFELEHYFTLSKGVIINKEEKQEEEEISDPEYDAEFFEEIGLEMPE